MEQSPGPCGDLLEEEQDENDEKIGPTNPLLVDLVITRILSHILGPNISSALGSSRLYELKQISKLWYQKVNEYYKDVHGSGQIRFPFPLSLEDSHTEKLVHFLDSPLPYEQGPFSCFLFSSEFFSGVNTSNNYLFNVFAHQCYNILKRIELTFDSGSYPLKEMWRESAEQLGKSGTEFPNLVEISVNVYFSGDRQDAVNPQITSELEFEHFFGMEAIMQTLFKKSRNLHTLNYKCRSDAEKREFLERHAQDSFSLLPKLPESVRNLSLDLNCSTGALEKTLLTQDRIKLEKFKYVFQGEFGHLEEIVRGIVKTHRTTLVSLWVHISHRLGPIPHPFPIPQPIPLPQGVLIPPHSNVRTSPFPMNSFPVLENLCLLYNQLPSLDPKSSNQTCSSLTNAFPNVKNLQLRGTTGEVLRYFDCLDVLMGFAHIENLDAEWPHFTFPPASTCFRNLKILKLKCFFTLLKNLDTIFSNMVLLEELELSTDLPSPSSGDHTSCLDAVLLGAKNLSNPRKVCIELFTKIEGGKLCIGDIAGIPFNPVNSFLNLKQLRRFTLDVGTWTSYITDITAHFFLTMKKLQQLDLCLQGVSETYLKRMRRRFYLNEAKLPRNWDDLQVKATVRSMRSSMESYAQSQAIVAQHVME